MNMKITIDGKEFAAELDETILNVAGKNGIKIPILCHSKEFGCKSQCMICAVQLENGNMIPACSTKVQPDMCIQTSNEEIINFRKSMLEILLSEHIGDCKAPCQLVCPEFANIPKIFEKIEAGEKVSLPDCEDCSAPCEKACRRGRIDTAITIKDIFMGSDSAGKLTSDVKKEYNHKLGAVTDERKQYLLDDIVMRNGDKKFSIHEISRCLQCGCSADSNCALQKIGTELNAKQNEFRVSDLMLKPKIYTDKLVFDPNKCIRCLQCTNIEFGGKSLCVNHKGENIEPGPPIGQKWQDVVAGIEDKLAAFCPTGAMEIIVN
ncbi:MAG: 2Fe-2S iron-sulfur cluster-binding protein [Kiritimatiellae bacterium]|jgi:ferredoxin|nr:2Fe-2S iron-sulfur cluster-binding protein [Kiritimatiellia bacterium]